MKANCADEKFFVTDISFLSGELQSCQPKATCNISLYIIDEIMSLLIAITLVLFFLSPPIN